MKHYYVTDGYGNTLGPFETKEIAAYTLISAVSDALYDGVDPVKCRIEEANDEPKEEKPKKESPKEERPKDTPELIPDYEAAAEYLDGPYTDMMIDFRNEDAINALNRLLTLAKAWNKADNFTPDWDDEKQKKWVPVFVKTPKGWELSHIAKYSIYANPCDTNLCFKTEERARQFAGKFIDEFQEAMK